MKKMKFLAVLLVLCMTATLFAGCGNKEVAEETKAAVETAAQAGAETEAAEEEEIAEIVMAHFSAAPINEEEVQKVEDAINAITEAEIATHVDLLVYDIGTYAQQINLMSSAGERLDLLHTFYFGITFAGMQSANQLMPLNDLLDEYGQGIQEVVNPAYLQTTSFGGQIYGVPANKDQVSGVHYAMRTDILEELGLLEKAQAIKSMDDVEEILEAVKQNTDLTPMYSQTTGPVHFSPAYLMGNFEEDSVGFAKIVNDYIGVMYDDPTKVVNLFATEEFKESVELMYEWYQKGYISGDALTRTDQNIEAVRNNSCFSYFYAAEESTKLANLQGVGYDMTVVTVYNHPVATSTVNLINWVIPVTSEEPEAAMKMMNLMYTDARIIDLLGYGVEGVHYEVREDGTYGSIGGAETDPSNYPLQLSWLFGDQFKAGVWQTDTPDLRDRSRAINENAELCPLLGFAADVTGFDTQIAGITSAYNEYFSSLVNGYMDPDTAIAEFNAKLEAAGIQEVIDAVQAQLDAWLAENK